MGCLGSNSMHFLNALNCEVNGGSLMNMHVQIGTEDVLALLILAQHIALLLVGPLKELGWKWL